MPTVAFVGGTGKLGRGLALRFAAAGRAVLVGSRVEERARDTASRLRERLGAAGLRIPRLEGLGNATAVAASDVVFLTLPFETLEGFLTTFAPQLGGKIVVDVVNPLRLTDGRFDLIPCSAGSVGVHVQRAAPGARVAAAFKNVAAGHLLELERPVAGDTLVASDDADAKATVAALARCVPNLRAVDAGPLANAAFLESITALELNLNRLHKAVTSIRILGLP